MEHMSFRDFKLKKWRLIFDGPKNTNGDRIYERTDTSAEPEKPAHGRNAADKNDKSNVLSALVKKDNATKQNNETTNMWNTFEQCERNLLNGNATDCMKNHRPGTDGLGSDGDSIASSQGSSQSGGSTKVEDGLAHRTPPDMTDNLSDFSPWSSLDGSQQQNDQNSTEKATESEDGEVSNEMDTNEASTKSSSNESFKPNEIQQQSDESSTIGNDVKLSLEKLKLNEVEDGDKSTETVFKETNEEQPEPVSKMDDSPSATEDRPKQQKNSKHKHSRVENCIQENSSAPMCESVQKTVNPIYQKDSYTLGKSKNRNSSTNREMMYIPMVTILPDGNRSEFPFPVLNTSETGLRSLSSMAFSTGLAPIQLPSKSRHDKRPNNNSSSDDSSARKPQKVTFTKEQVELFTQQVTRILGTSDWNNATSAMRMYRDPVQEVETGFCHICEDKATGLHYGVFTCEGCKGFFKRTVQNKRVYHCSGVETCKVNKLQRNNCQYCRFKKCLQLGMIMAAVREDRMPGGRNSGVLYNLFKMKYRKRKTVNNECGAQGPVLTSKYNNVPTNSCLQWVRSNSAKGMVAASTYSQSTTDSNSNNYNTEMNEDQNLAKKPKLDVYSGEVDESSSSMSGSWRKFAFHTNQMTSKKREASVHGGMATKHDSFPALPHDLNMQEPANCNSATVPLHTMPQSVTDVQTLGVTPGVNYGLDPTTSYKRQNLHLVPGNGYGGGSTTNISSRIRSVSETRSLPDPSQGCPIAPNLLSPGEKKNNSYLLSHYASLNSNHAVPAGQLAHSQIHPIESAFIYNGHMGQQFPVYSQNGFSQIPTSSAGCTNMFLQSTFQQIPAHSNEKAPGRKSQQINQKSAEDDSPLCPSRSHSLPAYKTLKTEPVSPGGEGELAPVTVPRGPEEQSQTPRYLQQNLCESPSLYLPDENHMPHFLRHLVACEVSNELRKGTYDFAYFENSQTDLFSLSKEFISTLVRWFYSLPFHTKLPHQFLSKAISHRWQDMILWTALRQQAHNILPPFNATPESLYYSYMAEIHRFIRNRLKHDISIVDLHNQAHNAVDRVSQLVLEFRQLCISNEEFVLLKVILFLGQDMSTDEESMKRMCLCLLQTLTAQQSPHQTDRMNRLLHLLPCVSDVAKLLLTEKMMCVPFALTTVPGKHQQK